MNAPAIWIGIPLAAAAVAAFSLRERTSALVGGVTCAILGLIALLIPIDEALLIGPVSLKIGSTASLLGRGLVISKAEGPLLAFVFGMCALWFLGAEAAGVARRLVPYGLLIAALLIAAIAVEPFLYAAVLIEVAALAAIPLLVQDGETPGTAVLRFLIYQTLGMPCILLAGWMLAGVEASPGDLSMTIQATVMLSLGFIFLLGIFPLNSWIPGLVEQSHPYVAGFLLWLLPTAIVVFGLSILDGYAWLRSSPQIASGLRLLGTAMLVLGGAQSALERDLRRMLGHTVVAETGLLLLGATLASTAGTNTIFTFFVPRALCLGLWSLALAIVQDAGEGTELGDLRTIGRKYPWAGISLVLSALCASGFPLLAGFPPRIDVWAGMANVSTAVAIWFALGLGGLMAGAIRQLAGLLRARSQDVAVPQETLIQRLMLGAGMAALVALGLLPRSVAFLVDRLPLMFDHLGR